MLFSHGITSSWGATIGFFGTKSFKIEDIKSDKVVFFFSVMQK